MALLEIHHVARSFDGVLAVDDISFAVSESEFVSIIGPNGAGKTTLFNLITGTDRPTHGEITFEAKSLVGLKADQFARRGIARTFQHGRVFGNLSVLDNVLVGAHARLRAVRPHLALIGPLAELALALVRPSGVNAEERWLREEVLEILELFGDRLLPRLDHP